jgi:uncharacterized protein YjdB
MKKIFGFALGLYVAMFLATTAFSVTKKDPRLVTSSNPAGITYVVEVNLTSTASLCGSYQITLTNEDGVPVAASKVFNVGITNYIFHENGPVEGTRIAHMEKINSSFSGVCGQILHSPSSAVTTNFRNGSTYMFYLSPTMLPGND